jgi:hypothetical protein
MFIDMIGQLDLLMLSAISLQHYNVEAYYRLFYLVLGKLAFYEFRIRHFVRCFVLPVLCPSRMGPNKAKD